MIDESLMNEFLVDTQTHLEIIEEDALKLEKDPANEELIGDVFRRVHSIKGNAGIMGLSDIYAYGQEFESFLEGIRERNLAELEEIERIFHLLDGLKSRINQLRGLEPEDEIRPEETPAPYPVPAAEKSPEPKPSPEAQQPKPAAAVPVSSAAVNPNPATAPAASQSKNTATLPDKPITILSFLLGGELYGIDIMKVKEIITYELVTRVPNTKWFVEGVMNLRDQVIPVLDLGKKLRISSGHENGDEGKSEKNIIVVEISKVSTGLMVDNVTGIKVFDPSMITPPKNFAGKISTEFLMGVGKGDDEKVIILNTMDICDPAEMLY